MRRLVLTLLLTFALPASAATIITRGSLSAINLGFGNTPAASGSCPTTPVLITATGSGSIQVPANCGHILPEVWTAGAQGNGGSGNGSGGAGGGYVTNSVPYAVTSGTYMYYYNPAGQAGITGNYTVSAPDGWVNVAVINAEPTGPSQGVAATSAFGPSAPGSENFGGTNRGYSGGTGGNDSGGTGGGGGGSAGSGGNGNRGTNGSGGGTGGVAGTPDGGTGGNGGTTSGSTGTNPGCGGGGANNSGAVSGASCPGQIRITWSP